MQFNTTIRRKDKGYQIIVSYKDGYKWKQKSKQGFATQRDAKLYGQQIVDNLKKTITAQIDDSLKDITLIQFFEIFAKDKINLSYGSILTYRNSLRVVERLKNKKIVDITHTMIRNEFSQSPYAVSTQKLCKRILNVIFNYAISPYHIIATNPCKGITFTNRTQQQLKILDENDLKALERMKSNHYMYYVMFMVARYTGARYGEIIGITWNDIYLDKAIISINKQWSITGNGLHGFSPLKSNNGYRDVPIPPRLIDILKAYKTTSTTDRLFPTKNAKSSRANYILKLYVPNKSIHAFRHTYATTLLSNNVDIKTVASLLGDTVDTVIKNYIHYSDEMRKNAAENVANIFG